MRSCEQTRDESYIWHEEDHIILSQLIAEILDLIRGHRLTSWQLKAFR